MDIVGLMSGTSLDGLDIALCRFSDSGRQYSILAATTVAYSPSLRHRLAALPSASAEEYALANVDFGRFMGQQVRRFLDERGLSADAVASHGHTVFHRPDLGLTAQIGDADALSVAASLPVVSSFRTLDVALGGQGAPLVPVGDELLFPSFDACLNLGGIANISYREDGHRKAYDICPCNMALNEQAALLGLPFDPEGSHASSGSVCAPLLQRLAALPFYALCPPKSLGREWYEAQFAPIVRSATLPPADALRTIVEHVAEEVGAALCRCSASSLLLTGGGALNTFLVERIREKAPGVSVVVPDLLTVNYKEALIFALLGHLRLLGKVNVWKEVTGARCSSSSGLLTGSFSAENIGLNLS